MHKVGRELEDTNRLLYCARAPQLMVFGLASVKRCCTWADERYRRQAAKTPRAGRKSRAERIEHLSESDYCSTLIRQALPATGEHG